MRICRRVAMVPGQSLHGRFIQKILVCACFLSLLYFFIILPEYLTKEEILANTEKNVRRQYTSAAPAPPQRKVKKILAWTKLFDRDFLLYHNHKPLSGHTGFASCPIYKECEWTIEKSAVESADAVLFHIFPNDFQLTDVPTYRNPQQKWIAMNLEPPIRFREGKMAKLDGLFNVTATYEEDADISLPYGFYYKRKTALKNYLPNNKNRTKPVVWMVSRCHTMSRREVYADDLKKYIDVDIFGDCGKKAPTKGSPPLNVDFRTKLAKDYYFYLAFENSDCVDYITEKFWTTLLAGLVPIVRGQLPRYEKHAPPGSYINADAFFSYADLAEYLKFLIDNPAEYNKYFKWREWYTIGTTGAFINLDVHCKICELLHTQPEYHKVYNMSTRYSSFHRCFSYHHNLPQIDFEVEKAYQDEFANFL